MEENEVTNEDEEEKSAEEKQTDLEMNYKFCAIHSQIRTIYDEWYGRGKFNYTINGFCGGIDFLNKKYKDTWRAKHDQGKKKLYSRMKIIINFIENVADLKGKEPEHVIFIIDEHLKEKRRCRVSTIADYLRDKKDEVLDLMY